MEKYAVLDKMTHVSLFSGIGGIDLAAEWAGFRTILQVEIADYPTRVLERHWPDVPRIRDIREVTGESVAEPVTVVSGGPPCQPSSTAGKRRGRDDDRWLWPEFARVVECFLPTWVVAENPLGILSLEDGVAIEEWIARLEAAGYAFLPPVVYPLAALGADHRRYRVLFVAHAESGRLEKLRLHEGQGAEGQGAFDVVRTGQAPPDVDGQGSQAKGTVRGTEEIAGNVGPWDTRSRLLRMVHGVRGRMDGRRIRALGNAVSPQQAYPIFAAIAEVERQ